VRYCKKGKKNRIEKREKEEVERGGE